MKKRRQTAAKEQGLHTVNAHLVGCAGLDTVGAGKGIVTIDIRDGCHGRTGLALNGHIVEVGIKASTCIPLDANLGIRGRGRRYR